MSTLSISGPLLVLFLFFLELSSILVLFALQVRNSSFQEFNLLFKKGLILLILAFSLHDLALEFTDLCLGGSQLLSHLFNLVMSFLFKSLRLLDKFLLGKNFLMLGTF